MHVERAVFFDGHFSDHAFDIVHAVLFNRPPVEFVEVFSRCTHVDIKHVALRIGVVVSREDRVLCRVHTAYFRTVFVTLFRIRRTAASDALDEYDRFGMPAVGGAEQGAAGRPRRIHEAFEFEGRYDVFALRIRELVELRQVDRIVAGRGDDGSVFFFDERIFRTVVDRLRLTHHRTDAAFSRRELHAVCGIDRRDFRNGLRKGNIDRGALVEIHIEFVRHFFLRTLLHAFAAARTFRFVDVARFALYRHGKVSDESFDIRHFAVREDSDIFILPAFDHARREDTGRTVERRKGFVELRHFAADRRLRFDDVYRKPRVRDVDRRLNARDTSADDESALGDRRFARSERFVQQHFCDRSFSERNRFCRRRRHIFAYPRILLSDVRYFEQVGIDTRFFRTLSERRFVHTRRTGTHDDSAELMFFYRVGYEILTRLRAHIGVVRRKDDARFFSERVRDGFYIDRARYIRAAVAHKNSDFSHTHFLYFLNALTIACCGISPSI